MERSIDRILTTHTGSLPRPQDVVDLLLADQENPGSKTAELAKAADKGMIIQDIRLLQKSGGKSGDWSAETSDGN